MDALFVIPMRRLYRVLIGGLLGVCLSSWVVLLTALPSVAVPVSSVPNPQTTSGSWVSDTANMLSPESESQLNQLISQLEATTGAELAIVTVPDTRPAASPKQFATELFNTWGIGKAGEDNGVLFLVSKGDRRNEIETGYGIEGVLPDALVGQILRTQVTPQFKNGNFDAGVLAGTQAMVDILSGEASASAFKVSPAQSWTDRLGFKVEWIFNRVVIVVAGLAWGAIALLKKLAKAYQKPIYIEPTGRSNLESASLLLDTLFRVALRSLIGQDMANAKGVSTLLDPSTLQPHSNGPLIDSLATRFNDLTGLDTPPPTRLKRTLSATSKSSQPKSLLVDFRWSEDLLQSSRTLFCLALLGATISAIFLQGKVTWLVGVTLLWMVYEMGLNIIWIARYKNADASTRQTVENPIGASLKFDILEIMCLLIILFTVLMVLGLFAIPAFLTAVFSTCAGILRLVRQLPEDPIIHCQSCNHPMQSLNNQLLNKHLRDAEKVEVGLRTKAYEAWCCQACSDKKTEPGNLSGHLFSLVLNNEQYKNCRTCKALTVEVSSTVLKEATTTEAGSKLTIRDCQCCGQHTEVNSVIPKIVPVSSRQNSSGYSHDVSSYSYDSGSSSSYSGDSGGSFGGGDSGGGGAGDSW
ncbi:MAG: TPM domain-containing protein [Cyanobacteria bacterium J06649_4]